MSVVIGWVLVMILAVAAKELAHDSSWAIYVGVWLAWLVGCVTTRIAVYRQVRR